MTHDFDDKRIEEAESRERDLERGWRPFGSDRQEELLAEGKEALKEAGWPDDSEEISN